MIIDDQILKALSEYTARLENNVQLKLFHGEHLKRQELIEMLENVASLSDKIDFIYSNDHETQVREGLTFELLADEKKTGIIFSGIPGGHEFNSFILALLQAGGAPVKLDAGLQKQIERIDQDLLFETIVSLDCHVCPDIVQTFNQLCILNPRISHETIDGGVHQQLTEERNLQGVPAVYLNGKPFSNGQISAAQIIERITASYAKDTPASADTEEAEPDEYDVTVIGGGPAAVASAIYTARKGLSVLLVAEKFGGQVSETVGIENFISTGKTTGKALTADFRAHLNDYPVTVRQDIRVKTVEHDADTQMNKLELSSGDRVKSKSVIVATGAKWRELGIPGEKENIGNGVAYCPHCDGPFFKGKDVVVVGGGNSGIEAALDLSGIAKHVKVVEFMDTLKADQILVDKAQATSNVSISTSVAMQEIVAGSNGVTGIRLKHRETDEVLEHKTDGVFVQIGLVPNSAFLDKLLETNEHGEIIINQKCETNIPGIFACGDVTNIDYKQIVIAMGEGAKAGLTAFEYLLKSTPAG